MNTWLHRISHHAELSYPLLARGYLSIGYSDFDNDEFIRQTRSDGCAYFNATIEDAWGKCPRTRYNLWRFIVEMQVGDWVVVPSWGVFSVYEITEDVCPLPRIETDGLTTWNHEAVINTERGLMVGGNVIDLGFGRKVTPIAVNLSRYDYTDAALSSRMKIRNTNANISDLEESVRKAIAAADSSQPINLHSQILAASRANVLKLIQSELIPDKFESLIKWYFEKIGASEVSIPAKNESGKEGDADIVAVFEQLKTIYYVQAKHHRNESSQWATEQIKAYVDHKDKMDDGYTKVAWVVTFGDSFSDAAVKLSKDNSIQLFTGPDLARMILEAGIENLGKAF